jgi:hypothetical protein
METRRIRRLARRRTYRTVVLASSLAALGCALGLALPRSTLASGLLFVAASCCAAIVVMRDDSRAPTHGLHRAVRLPVRASMSATLESFRSRLVGTLRALLPRGRSPAALALDEPDDEAEAWWGSQSPLGSVPVTFLLADAVPPVPDDTGSSPPGGTVEHAEPVDRPVPGPVLAAPMRTAHVPAEDTRSPSRVEQAMVGTRRSVDALAKRFRRHREEAGAST